MHTRAVKLSVLVESYTTEEYASLPLKVALLLRDRVSDKKAYTAIAKSYDIPVGTVRSRIHRARLGPRSQDFVLCPTEALTMAAERRGPLLHARVAMLRAMNHGRGGCSGRIATHWGKLKREE
jgi:hypothetical protein